MRRVAAAMAMLTIGAAPVPDAARVAELARDAMTRTGAKQLAIAVVDRGRVVSAQAFGQRNLKGDPLTTRTAMYAASLCKAMFAYLVMQLVDEGRIDLDRPIASNLKKPLPEYGNLPRSMGNWGDLAGDERWRAITPRMALTHSTGFANFAFLEPDQKLHIHFQPGSRYAYSGEGLLLLQFMLSEGLGLDLKQEFERRVFAPLGMTRTAITWRDDLADDMSSQWAADGSAIGHKYRDRVRVAGSADTSIDDMAQFAAALVRGDGLKPASARALREGWLPITTPSQFPTLAPELPPARRIAGLRAGPGVVTFAGPQGRGFYKGGHDDYTANTMVCVAKRQRCVVILSSDVRAESAYPALVRAVLGETGVPYRWEYPELKAW